MPVVSTFEKQLCAAARAGDLNAIVAALQAGARIDAAPARNRNPALIVAAEAGQADAISLLLERGAAPDVLSTGDNSNPLQKALAKNRAASVAALLKHEYYQHQATGGYLTCMVTFTTGTAVFQMLSDLQFALRPVTSDNQSPGWTPLHEAAYTANEMWVRELLERGLARAKCTDAHGRTPLHGIRPMRRPYPVHGSFIPMVAGTDANENATRAAAALIIHGADVESRANNGKPPTIVDDPTFSQRIQDAVRNRCTGVFPSADLKRLHPTALQRYIGPVFQTPKFVRGRRGPARPATVPRAELLALEAAVMGGDCSALGHLLPQVGNLDLRLSGKRTPLQLAAEKGRAEVVQQLIAAGANLEGAPLAGRTALHFAAANAHASTVEVLIQAGANPKAYDNMGYTPLMMTAMNPSGAEVAKVLMRGGASATAAMQPQKITPQNNKIAIQSGSYENKWTALHYAVIYGNVSVLAALLESGADPNAAEEVTKLTPMHLSCSDLEISLKKRENCGRVLLQHGADPTLKDSKGLTSLDFALKYGVTALLQEMQQAEKRLHSNEKVRKDPTEEMGDAVASGDEPVTCETVGADEPEGCWQV